MAVYTCGYVDRYALTIVLDQVKRDFAASDAFMGFLAGPAFALFFTLASLPVARLADRYSRVGILALGCATWSGFTLACALAETRLGFTIARLGVRLGEAACLAPAYSLLSEHFPRGRRVLAVGFFNVSVCLGQVIGLWLGGGLALELGWRRMFEWIGWPGLALALLFRLVVREPARGALDAGSGGFAAGDGAPEGAGDGSRAGQGFYRTAQRLLRMPAYRWLIGAAALTTFSGMGFAYWAPVFFMRLHQLSAAEVGRDYGLIFGLSAMTGALLAGHFGNRLSARRSGAALSISMLAAAACLLGMAAVCFAPSRPLALGLLVPAGIASGAWLVPVQATIQDLVDARTRATAAALFACASLLIGFLGPWAVGALSDAWAAARGAGSLRPAIATALLPGVLGVFALRRALGHALRQPVHGVPAH